MVVPADVFQLFPCVVESEVEGLVLGCPGFPVWVEAIDSAQGGGESLEMELFDSKEKRMLGGEVRDHGAKEVCRKWRVVGPAQISSGLWMGIRLPRRRMEEEEELEERNCWKLPVDWRLEVEVAAGAVVEAVVVVRSEKRCLDHELLIAVHVFGC